MKCGGEFRDGGGKRTCCSGASSCFLISATCAIVGLTIGPAFAATPQSLASVSLFCVDVVSCFDGRAWSRSLRHSSLSSAFLIKSWASLTEQSFRLIRRSAGIHSWSRTTRVRGGPSPGLKRKRKRSRCLLQSLAVCSLVLKPWRMRSICTCRPAAMRRLSFPRWSLSASRALSKHAS